jgi:hypothetical protein
VRASVYTGLPQLWAVAYACCLSSDPSGCTGTATGVLTRCYTGVAFYWRDVSAYQLQFAAAASGYGLGLPCICSATATHLWVSQPYGCCARMGSYGALWSVCFARSILSAAAIGLGVS